MTDWQHNQAVLLQGTRTALESFFKQKGREDLCSIGYVFELWNESESFHICADRWSYRKACPDWESAETRWNSGGHEFPACLLSLRELGEEWKAISTKLHKLADDKRYSQEVYDGLVRTGCIVLAQLAGDGFFGDWKTIDFNVSEVGDPGDVVIERDKAIRRLIESSKQTKDGPE